MKKKNLLFLTSLYKTWPWYYDKETILDIHKKIIIMQHKEINKLKSKNDLQITKSKIKIKRKQKEFPPQLI